VFDEYARMFRLDDATLHSTRILDAASGVSSFCAEANAQGYQVTASDRIYQFSADEIEQKCRRDLDNMLVQLSGVTHNYVWDYFPTLDALRAKREEAYRAFVADYRQHGNERYIPTTYPITQFADGAFDLTLVSHFLFLYDEQLDYDFHRRTLLELLRITTREVRLFPLVNLRTERAASVTQLLDDPVFAPYDIRIQRVDYEFIRNSSEMMIIRHPRSSSA
jgi:hypothetical protein